MNMKEIGKLVKNARKKHRMTQDELAKKAGVSRKTVSDIENGQRADVGLQRLLAVFKYIDLVFEVKPFVAPTLKDLLREQSREEARSSSATSHGR
jgi:transcriptional regulator with XRE-family HTH domain